MNSPSTQLHYVFRIACAMCFIGHGAFGIITKQIWCNYFGVFGIAEPQAYALMPIVGGVDIALGIILIIYPIQAVAWWLIIWGLFTASLRPLSGEPFAEFLERAGNYGAPLILLFLQDDFKWKLQNMFSRIKPQSSLTEQQINKIELTLRIVGFLLLIGHGWLNMIGKPGLLKQYSGVGFSDPNLIARFIGIFEIAGAFIILLKPFKQIVLLLFVWKMFSEMFYPAYGIFEWVERGGNYAVLLGLWFMLRTQHDLNKNEKAVLFKKGMSMSGEFGVKFLFLSGITACCFMSCGKSTLTSDDVQRLFVENKVYPKVIEYEFFCDDESTAQRVYDLGLVKEGYLTSQLKHTARDFGKPLIYFTEKSKLYLLPTSDTLRGTYAQMIKVGEEHFLEIEKIVLSPKGTRAAVSYLVKKQNLTPFSVMTVEDVSTEKTFRRESSFTLTPDGWKWDGKVMKR